MLAGAIITANIINHLDLAVAVVYPRGGLSASPFKPDGRSFHFVCVRKKKLPLKALDLASTVDLRENVS